MELSVLPRRRRLEREEEEGQDLEEEEAKAGGVHYFHIRNLAATIIELEFLLPLPIDEGSFRPGNLSWDDCIHNSSSFSPYNSGTVTPQPREEGGMLLRRFFLRTKNVCWSPAEERGKEWVAHLCKLAPNFRRGASRLIVRKNIPETHFLKMFPFEYHIVSCEIVGESSFFPSLYFCPCNLSFPSSSDITGWLRLTFVICSFPYTYESCYGLLRWAIVHFVFK